jgi:hypothetical protein
MIWRDLRGGLLSSQAAQPTRSGRVDKKGKIRIEENNRMQEQKMGGSGTLYSCKAARGC